MMPMSQSRLPLIKSRSLSVNLRHFALTEPFICFHLPSTWSQFMYFASFRSVVYVFMRCSRLGKDALPTLISGKCPLLQHRSTARKVTSLGNSSENGIFAVVFSSGLRLDGGQLKQEVSLQLFFIA